MYEKVSTAEQHGTARHSTAQHHTVRQGTAPHGAALLNGAALLSWRCGALLSCPELMSQAELRWDLVC